MSATKDGKENEKNGAIETVHRGALREVVRDSRTFTDSGELKARLCSLTEGIISLSLLAPHPSSFLSEDAQSVDPRLHSGLFGVAPMIRKVSILPGVLRRSPQGG